MAEAHTTGLQPAVQRQAVTVPALLALVEATLRLVHADAPGRPPVTLDSVLDRDLALDSLSRMELLLRVERAFGVSLPEQTLQRAETVADLLLAAQQAAGAGTGTVAARTQPAGAPAPPGQSASLLAPPAAAQQMLVHVPPDGPSVAPPTVAPAAAQTLLDVLDWHVQAHPGRTQFICLLDDIEHPITYGE